jgi:murein L,D-transpeptidase YafK
VTAPGRRSGPGVAVPTVLAVLGIALVVSAARALSAGEPWVLVDTGRGVVEVVQEGQVRLRLPDIAIGRYGAARDKQRGDNRTPLGMFRVSRIDPDSPFHLFIGLDYPTPVHARRAAAAGVIGPDERRAIEEAFEAGRAPPQHTPLGGFIGLHGIGRGDPAVHARYNWTRGCVALTDEQIDRLVPWIRLGTRVEIR